MFHFLQNEAYTDGLKKKKKEDIKGKLTAKKKGHKRKPSRKGCELTK